jgi:hypothetical protein
MAKLANYDGDLHMMIVPPQPVNLNYLCFLRYLGERGRLEHEIAGPVSGELVTEAIEQIAQKSPDYTGKAA